MAITLMDQTPLQIVLAHEIQALPARRPSPEHSWAPSDSKAQHPIKQEALRGKKKSEIGNKTDFDQIRRKQK
jgi:hypothetical protein